MYKGYKLMADLMKNKTDQLFMVNKNKYENLK